MLSARDSVATHAAGLKKNGGTPLKRKEGEGKHIHITVSPKLQEICVVFCCAKGKIYSEEQQKETRSESSGRENNKERTNSHPQSRQQPGFWTIS